MIFSNSTKEIYYLLSKRMNCYDIYILHKIMNIKKNMEDNDNINWYISRKNIELMKQSQLNNIQVLSYDGFILNYEKNIYSNPSLKEKCETLNYYTKHYGTYEIPKKLFNYQCLFLTDLVGNKCIRSIIRKKIDDTIFYEYKTIAIVPNGFNDPIERYPSVMNISL